MFSSQNENDDFMGGNNSDNESDNGGTSKYKPYKFSGKNHSFDSKTERAHIQNLRQFSGDYLGHNSVIHKSTFTPLGEVTKAQDL